MRYAHILICVCVHYAQFGLTVFALPSNEVIEGMMQGPDQEPLNLEKWNYIDVCWEQQNVP